MGRILVLVVLLAAVGAVAWYKLGGGGGGAGAVEDSIVDGTLLGKTLDEASTSLGAQPVEQLNPDGEKSTAKIYLYTLADAKPDRQLVRIRVAATGAIIAANFVDASGNVINVEGGN
jgi:hypothetical protein